MGSARRIAAGTILWLLLLAGLVMPILFNIGYEPYNFEIWLVLTALAILAIAANLLPRWMTGMAIGLLLMLTIHVHYIPKDIDRVDLIIFFGFFVASVLWPRLLLLAGAASGIAVSSYTALMISSFWDERGLSLDEAGSGPAVIHLVLDELAAPAGLPKNILPPIVVKEASDWFVRRGFTVFERSYSEQTSTKISLALLANADRQDIDPMSHLQRYDNSTPSGITFALTSASAFAAIAERRAIRSLTTSYFDVRPAIAEISEASASAVYSTRIPNPMISTFGLSVKDRLLVMRGSVHNWLKGRRKVDLYQWWTQTTATGRAFDAGNAIASRLTPLTSMVAFDHLIKVDLQNMRRGQYLFAHLLTPHFPYVFSEECNLRPLHEWRNKTVLPGQRDTLETRAERYRLYAEQLACTRKQIDRLLIAIESNSELTDAVLIINGDHGSRIAIEDRENLLQEGYGEDDYLRDWHAAFFAVRLPERQGGVVAEPYTIHDLFWALISNNFVDLPVTDLPVRPLAGRLYP